MYENLRSSPTNYHKHARKNANAYVDGAVFTKLPPFCKALDYEKIGNFNVKYGFTK